MKKNVMRIAALLLLLSLLLSLTACGENAKRQEAVDAYRKAAAGYNATPTARPPMPTM
ncbi:unknown [Firmicutes bacterium CAG:124]|nr:unknown [Firmicutes bacterium CAG:124]